MGVWFKRRIGGFLTGLDLKRLNFMTLFLFHLWIVPYLVASFHMGIRSLTTGNS